MASRTAPGASGRTEAPQGWWTDTREGTESAGGPRGASTPAEGGPLRRRRLLEPLPVFRPELRHLGRDDRPAVALVGILPVIVLVVRLGGIEHARRPDLGDDRVVEHAVR